MAWDIYYARRLKAANRAKNIEPSVKALLAFSDLDDDALDEAIELLDGEEVS